jgi:predicted kinase
MSFYIILRGPAGAGKTTLSKKLAKIYNGYHINIDKIKHGLGLKHSEKEKLEANKFIVKEIKEYLDKGIVVILDEVLYYKSQLDQLEQLPYEHYVFSLITPLNLCLKRNNERRQKGERKTSDEDIKLVYNLVFKLKRGIEISTYNRPIDESLNEILSYLPPTPS